MKRILAIDFGLKRCGIAVTDPLCTFASPLETVSSIDLMHFLAEYFVKNRVETVVIGMPKQFNNEASEIEPNILLFIEAFEKKFPKIKTERVDERFTSKIASQTLFLAGAKKKDRQKKENIDKVSAAIILQSYLETI